MQSLLLERTIKIINETSNGVLHITMSGIEVPFDSEDCFEDLQCRLQDATKARDKHTRGSELRMCYNGLMKNYRLMLKRHPIHIQRKQSGVAE